MPDGGAVFRLDLANLQVFSDEILHEVYEKNRKEYGMPIKKLHIPQYSDKKD